MCLQALSPLSLPCPRYISPNREPVHRLEIAWRNELTSRNYIAQLVLKKRKQVERVRERRRRENYSKKRRQAERDRARMNRQRQRESYREIQRQRERQQNNDMMTESVVLMSL